MGTIVVEIINDKAYRLLEDLADLDIIRLHKPIKGATDMPVKTPEFGFAKNMIRRISDNFNEPLTEFNDYMP
jgi:hypothetical protein